MNILCTSRPSWTWTDKHSDVTCDEPRSLNNILRFNLLIRPRARTRGSAFTCQRVMCMADVNVTFALFVFAPDCLSVNESLESLPGLTIWSTTTT